MAAPTVHTSSAGPPKAGDGTLHVTAMGPNLFVTSPLPPTGAVTIGRAEDADVRVVDESASRLHARLHVGDGSQLYIEDLGTKNGTFLRESRIAPNERVPFQPGEAINIGFTILMVQRRRASPQTRRFRTHATFEESLQEACDRAAQRGSTFAIARLRIEGDDSAGRGSDTLARGLRAGDLLAQYAPGDYEILLPDTGSERTHAIVDDWGRRLAAEGLASNIVVASFPADGRTPDALIGRVNSLSRGREVEPSGEPVMRSDAVHKVYRMAERAAGGQTADGLISVLVLGESGVGKDVLARWIHARSPRAKGPFVSVNCGAFTESLLNSELFGHERGAFTDAKATKTGLLETASGGSVFLDEIGDMPLALQVRLLHAIENRRISRVGDPTKERAIDVRFIAATHRDLEAMVALGTFRQDLYYRLNQISLNLPPLRERPDEIEALARHFLARMAGPGGAQRRVPSLSGEALDLLRSYAWPGNARELRNMIDRALVLCDGPEITPEHLDTEKMRATRLVHDTRTTSPLSVVTYDAAVASDGAMPLHLSAADAAERTRVLSALAEAAGSQTGAAKLLGISRGTLIERMKRFGIRRPRAR